MMGNFADLPPGLDGRQRRELGRAHRGRPEEEEFAAMIQRGKRRGTLLIAAGVMLVTVFTLLILLA